MADKYVISDSSHHGNTRVTLTFQHDGGGPVYPGIESGIIDAVKAYLVSRDPESPQSVQAKAYSTVVTDV
ncbi:hypothetical protein ACF067_28045 [Streptomyces albidoflavus]